MTEEADPKGKRSHVGLCADCPTRGASNPHADRFSTFASGRPATRDSLSTRASPSCAAPVTRPRRSSRVDWLAGSQPENQGGVYLLRADSSTTTDLGNSFRPASKTVNSTTVCSKPWVQVGQASRIMVVSGSFLLPIPDETEVLRALGGSRRRRPCRILPRIEARRLNQSLRNGRAGVKVQVSAVG